MKRDHRNPAYDGSHHPHGTISRYTHGACRCRECKAAKALQGRLLKAKHRATENRDAPSSNPTRLAATRTANGGYVEPMTETT